MKTHIIKLNDSIETICKNNNINIIKIKTSSDPKCHVKFREIYIHPIKSNKSYAIALHEIGHILGDKSEIILNNEFYAWEWAIKNAIYWNDTMSVRVIKSFVSYSKSEMLKVIYANQKYQKYQKY